MASASETALPAAAISMQGSSGSAWFQQKEELSGRVTISKGGPGIKHIKKDAMHSLVGMGYGMNVGSAPDS